MEKKLIKRVSINRANMVAAGENRELVIFGDIGAEFNINIIKINGSSKESYYNFKTNTFTEAFVAANNSHETMASEKFSKVIVFPIKLGFLINAFLISISASILNKSINAFS